MIFDKEPNDLRQGRDIQGVIRCVGTSCLMVLLFSIPIYLFEFKTDMENSHIF